MAKAMGFDSFKAGLEILYDSSDDNGDDANESDEGDGSEISACNSSNDAELTPKAKRPRIYKERLLKTESTWWKKYLSPAKKLHFATEPLGQDATHFRRMFRVPYRIFEDDLMRLTKLKWSNWRPDKIDSYSKPVADLELKLLGALFTLGTAATIML